MKDAFVMSDDNKSDVKTDRGLTLYDEGVMFRVAGLAREYLYFMKLSGTVSWSDDIEAVGGRYKVTFQIERTKSEIPPANR